MYFILEAFVSTEHSFKKVYQVQFRIKTAPSPEWKKINKKLKNYFNYNILYIYQLFDTKFKDEETCKLSL